MPRSVSTILAIALLAAVPGFAEDKTPALDGSWDWDPTAKQSDAKPVVLLERVVIKGDKLTFHYNLDGKKFTSPVEFKVGPAGGATRDFTFTPLEGANKGQAYLGLCEITAGKLRICYRGPGASRPKDFDDKHDPKTNDGTVFITLIPSPAD
jgi:uncharacterized protein (TIGR03067 family)